MKKVLITGGFGKIAKHFVKNFDQKFKITVVDINIDQDTFSEHVQIEKANLADYSTCLKVCKGNDIVIHMAAMVDPTSDSEEILDANINTTKNVFKAAVKSKCERLIFASSAQTIEGYPDDIQVSKDMLVRPKNIYGVSKCFGEALAAYYAFNNKISVICLRIGAYEFPKDFTAMNARDLSAFIHPDDFNQLLVGCVQTKNIKFEVLNAISNNRFKRLNISEAKDKVGYEPKADAFELFQFEQ